MLSRNGFTTPYHPYQVSSWLIFFWHCIIPGLLIAQFQPLPAKIFFLLVFYLSHLLVFIFGLIATKSNPSISVSIDPLYLETNENLNYYCTICKSYVTKTSKHCGSCDRCVNGFDHHCKWLNNCIGEKNYKTFISLIVSLEVSEFILFPFEVNGILNTNNRAIIGLLVFDAILNGFVILLVGYLIGIHLVLKCKGMTTYEYIKAMRKKNEKRIKPTQMDENGSIVKDVSVRKDSNKETKKSIIKGINKTVMENPYSFSIAKSASEEGVHLTFQLRYDSEPENLK